VAALAHQLARLIGPLHDVFSACPGGAPLGRLTTRQTLQIRAKITGFSGRRRSKGRRLYGSPAGPVNASRPPPDGQYERSQPLKWR
jgi:hypothetical protein